MDPITTAIVAALTAGVTTGTTDVGKKALVDAYDGLKAVIKKKFGKSEIPEAIEKLEARPESESRKGMVSEEIGVEKADKDPDVLSALQALVDSMKESPQGRQAISKFNIQGDVQSAVQAERIDNLTQNFG